MPRSGSKRSTALSSPTVPACSRSSTGSPRPAKRRAMCCDHRQVAGDQLGAQLGAVRVVRRQRGELVEQRREVGVVGVARAVSHAAGRGAPAAVGASASRPPAARVPETRALVGCVGTGRPYRRGRTVESERAWLEGASRCASSVSRSSVGRPDGVERDDRDASRPSRPSRTATPTGSSTSGVRRDALRAASTSAARRPRSRLQDGAARGDRRHAAGADRARRRGGDVHRPARRAAGRRARAGLRPARRPTTASAATSAGSACSTRTTTTSRC